MALTPSLEVPLEEVPADLLSAVLTPYRPHCRYLQRARFSPPEAAGRRESPWVSGSLSIPESCYIADTGHFNAVEFNICYNQLAYVLLAMCVERKRLPVVSHWTIEDYWRRQLPDVLIVDYASHFRAPMRSDRFEGMVQIVRAGARGGNVFLKTICRFQDEHGGSSEGEVLIVVVNGAQRDPSDELGR